MFGSTTRSSVHVPRLRREVYGDACVGQANLHMVSIAHKHDSVRVLAICSLPQSPSVTPCACMQAVKFPGSGGAVVGLCRDTDKLQALREEFESNNYVFAELLPNEAMVA